MSDAFYTMLGIVLPILIVQIVQLRQASITARKADEAAKAADAAAKAAEVTRSAIAEKADAARSTIAAKVEEMHQQTQSLYAQTIPTPVNKL